MKSLLIVITILLLGAAVFYLYNQNQAEMSSQPTNGQTTGKVVTSPEKDALLAGGSSYLHPDGSYGFLYPSDYTLDTQDPIHTRIFKQGEQQRPQSEMSDGVLVIFESVELNGQTLEQLVDARIQESTADGMSRLVEPKQTMTLNGFPGFTYVTEGLGTANTIVLQKNPESDKALIITFLVADPQEKGYQAELDAILSTVELHE